MACSRVLFLAWVALELATLAEYFEVASGDRKSIVTDGVIWAADGCSSASSLVGAAGGCAALRFRLGAAELACRASAAGAVFCEPFTASSYFRFRPETVCAGAITLYCDDCAALDVVAVPFGSGESSMTMISRGKPFL